MKRILTISVICLIFPILALYSQAEILPKKKYHAYRIQTPPVIDGVFDDMAWLPGEWAGDFVQHEPYDGRPPSQQTEFKLAFDDMNIYVAIRALDNAPDSITSRMSRRDNGDGDMVFVIFDSYHDLRTGFTFEFSRGPFRHDIFKQWPE